MQTQLEHQIADDESVDHMQDVVDFLDLLLVVTRRRRLIAGTVLGAAFLSLVTSYMLPQYFEARTALLPPQSSSTTTNLMAGQMAALTGISTRDLGMKNPNDLYVGLLGSESVANSLVDRFHLLDVYGASQLADARKRLTRLSSINSGKDGLITITVEDRNPRRAADLANGYVEELQHLSQRLAFTEAGQRRLFFEQQLENVKADLAKAESALGEMQKRTGVIEPAANAKALIEGIALLRAQLATKEVEAESMRMFATAANPDLRLVQQQALALRGQLSKLEVGVGEGPGGSTGKMSAAAVEYTGKLRDLKYQEALFEMLSRQYEMARLDEAKEGAVIQVVDRATPPERHVRPRRMLVAAASSLIAGFVVFVAVLLEGSARRAMGDPSRRYKLTELRNAWRIARG
jgi:tyrosine-protein kinase Etk/Wzc